MSLKSDVQDGLALVQEFGGLPQMNHGGGHQAQAGVVVVVVVPAEEGLAKPTGVFDGAEAVREARAVFEGPKLAFRIRIVIGDMRTAVGFDDAQIGQQQSHRFGFHGRTSIGMHGELAWQNVLRVTGMLDEPFGQLGAFAVGDHPTDDVAAEDVQDDIKMISGPFHRTAQLGDVPTPQLIGLSGQQLRLLIGRMGELIPALAAFATGFQQTIHGADGAMKPAFIE
ncbi:hypothetical protein SBA2_1230004 [Acidobacteriia bacterium SbA2]|nr:hypothetical protein SBA2_1230004 [Acidobacteriia bacterium SbA2]